MALHHVSESQWRAIAERGLDKKVIFRTALPERPYLLYLGRGSDRGFELHWENLRFIISGIVFAIPLSVFSPS